jgi:V/A-type H+-transporting ATPase subunit K
MAELSPIAWKAIASAATLIFAAWATAFAQARIGAAGTGAIAEKPESAGMIVALQALPEIIVVLGFVVAFLIIGMK